MVNSPSFFFQISQHVSKAKELVQSARESEKTQEIKGVIIDYKRMKDKRRDCKRQTYLATRTPNAVSLTYRELISSRIGIGQLDVDVV